MSHKAETIRLHQLDEGPRDECGVVGITGVDRASEMAFLSLYALQHRGQESAGICAIDGGVARLHKRLGLAAEVFDADVLQKLPGETALGHVRYSTAGGGQLANAQPIMVRYAEGDLAIAHNGNLTNAHDVRNRLVQEGAIFQTDSDSEVIIHLIARSRRDTIEGQIDDALTYLEGAFSVIISVRDTLFAVRDPRGFRPLVLGRKDEGFVVASETCALDIIGASFIRDVYPGEVLKLQGSKLFPMRHLEPALQQAPCIFELVYFARPDSKVFGVSVDRSRRAFGRQLAQEHPVEADAVLAVPDSANSAALGFSEASGIPFELGLLRNHYVGRTFIRPSQADRDFSARVKYAPVREALEGKRIVVVDDSLV
ncbi:MAG: amidophosphoribosyltransferase, partial [Longimicrobiales bacterium]